MAPETETLTVDELVVQANKTLGEFSETFRVTPEPFSPRTVYYYTRFGILPRIRGVRKAERYPAEWVYRLVFVRRLQQEMPSQVRVALTELVGEDSSMLPGIAKVLEALPDDRIRAIALGEEPLQILPITASARVAESDNLLYSEARMSYGTDSEYDWVDVYIGDVLNLRVRSDALNRATRQELEVAARLLERALSRKEEYP